MAASSSVAPAMKFCWRPEDVPPFPGVALKALNLMAGSDTSLIELCNLIRPDLGFSAEILRIANSPLVAFSKEVTSILQASMLLGFRRLRSVVITVGLRAYLAQGFTPLLESCWRHSLACAMIAERAAKVCALDKDNAYTAGIMHDIGRVVLAVSMPKEYLRIAERGAEHPRGLLQTEHELCGIDHCEAGGALVKAWALPLSLSIVTAHHHQLDSQATGLDALLPASCLLADALGFSIASYSNIDSYAEILNAFPEAARRAFPADPQQFASEINGQITLIESS